MNFDYDINGIDVTQPLIYGWFIGASVYVGKAKGGADRPLKHYQRNVNNLLAGRPYRKSKPNGFRSVHRAQALAVLDGVPMTLRLLGNCTESDLHESEQCWIKKLNADLNGGK